MITMNNIICICDRMEGWQIETEKALRYDDMSKGENKPEEKEDEVKEGLKYCRENEKAGVEEVAEMEMKR